MFSHYFSRALIALLLLCSPCFAKWPFDSVCDISNGKYSGSATLIGVTDDATIGLIISCAHTFDEGGTNATVQFLDGSTKKWKCTLLKIDFERDMSLWAIKNPPIVQPPAGVTTVDPKDGPFTAVGFPFYANGGMCYSVGKFVSFNENGYEVYITADVHSGYSGGALFNKHGEFCGIVCGNTPLVNGRPDERGNWESRHTTGEPMLEMVKPYMKVIE